MSLVPSSDHYYIIYRLRPFLKNNNHRENVIFFLGISAAIIFVSGDSVTYSMYTVIIRKLFFSHIFTVIYVNKNIFDFSLNLSFQSKIHFVTNIYSERLKKYS